MKLSRLFIPAVLLALMLSVPAQAQTVNPTILAFDHTDYALVASYEVGYFLGAASAPHMVVPVAKAAITKPTASYQFALPRPLFGTVTSKLRALYTNADASAGTTAWSEATAPFVLSPTTPANLRTP